MRFPCPSGRCCQCPARSSIPAWMGPWEDVRGSFPSTSGHPLLLEPVLSDFVIYLHLKGCSLLGGSPVLRFVSEFEAELCWKFAALGNKQAMFVCCGNSFRKSCHPSVTFVRDLVPNGAGPFCLWKRGRWWHLSWDMGRSSDRFCSWRALQRWEQWQVSGLCFPKFSKIILSPVQEVRLDGGRRVWG